MNLKLDGGIELSSKLSLGEDKDAIDLENGEILYKEGIVPKFFYIVHKGRMGLFKKTKNRVFLEDLAEEGDFLCEKFLFKNGKTTHSAVALESTEVLKVDISQMKIVLKDCPEWVNDLFQTMTARLDSSLAILEDHKITDERINKKIPLSKDEEENIRKKIMGK